MTLVEYDLDRIVIGSQDDRLCGHVDNKIAVRSGVRESRRASRSRTSPTVGFDEFIDPRQFEEAWIVWAV